MKAKSILISLINETITSYNQDYQRIKNKLKTNK